MMRCLLILTLSVSAQAATYYVDASAGLDTNSGLKPSLAWQTLGKVSGAALAAGDVIRFQCGQVFRGQLAPVTSGSSGNPITYTSYDGCAAKPQINGAFLLSSGSWTGGGGTNYVTDTFTRANSGTGWGTATSGADTSKTWSQNNTNFQISANKGIYTAGFGYGRNNIGDSHSNFELTGTWGSVPNVDRQFGFNVLGTPGDAAWSGYRIYYDPATGSGSLYLSRNVSGSGTGITSAVKGVLTAFSMRAVVQQVGGNYRVQVRLWTGTEPGTWDIDYTDTTPPSTSGTVAIEIGLDGSASSNMSSFTSSAPASSGYYQYSLAGDPGDIVTENGTLLTRQTSTTNVGNTAGSFYWASGTLYVHAADNSNPGSNGKSYEAGNAVPNAIYIATTNYLTFDNLTVTNSVGYGLTGGGNNVIAKNLTVLNNGGGIHLTGSNDTARFCTIQNAITSSYNAMDLTGTNAVEYHNTMYNIAGAFRHVGANGYIARNNILYLKDAQVNAIVVDSGVTDTPSMDYDIIYRPTVKHGFHQDLSEWGDSGNHRGQAETATAAIGLTSSRNTLNWRVIEPTQGTRDWSRMDSVQSELNALGVENIWLIRCVPAWANFDDGSYGTNNACDTIPGTDKNDTVFQNFVSQWTTFVTAAVNRYKGSVKKWEILNEQNQYDFFHKRGWTSNGNTANQFSTSVQEGMVMYIQAAMYDAIHAADSSAIVAFGGITGLNASCCTNGKGLLFMTDLYPLGLAAKEDAIAIHPYDNDAPDVDTAFSPNFTDIALIKAAMQAQGTAEGNKPIWITEWGDWGGLGNETTRSTYVAKAFDMLRTLYPYVTDTHFFFDVDTAGYTGSGLFNTSYGRKTAATTWGLNVQPNVSYKGTVYSWLDLKANVSGIATNSIVKNPTLTAPASNDVSLAAGSPALGAAVKITGIGQLVKKTAIRPDIGGIPYAKQCGLGSNANGSTCYGLDNRSGLVALP